MLYRYVSALHFKRFVSSSSSGAEEDAKAAGAVEAAAGVTGAEAATVAEARSAGCGLACGWSR
jgi:hypothetical protein